MCECMVFLEKGREDEWVYTVVIGADVSMFTLTLLPTHVDRFLHLELFIFLMTCAT